MTPFSDTDALAVTSSYFLQQGLRTIGDLRKVSAGLTLGAPPQFQQSPSGLPALESVYGFTPGAFKPLAIGDQYAAEITAPWRLRTSIPPTAARRRGLHAAPRSPPRVWLRTGRARRIGTRATRRGPGVRNDRQPGQLLSRRRSYDGSTPPSTSTTRTRRPHPRSTSFRPTG